jgi:hypothetical protein
MPSPFSGERIAKEADGPCVKTVLPAAKCEASKQRVEESTKVEEKSCQLAMAWPSCHRPDTYYAEPVIVVTSGEQALSRPLYALTAK